MEEESAGTRWGVQGNDGEESASLPLFNAREPRGAAALCRDGFPTS